MRLISNDEFLSALKDCLSTCNAQLSSSVVEEFYEHIFKELEDGKMCVIKVDNGRGGTLLVMSQGSQVILGTLMELITNLMFFKN